MLITSFQRRFWFPSAKEKKSQATFCSCYKSILLLSLGAKLACWQSELKTFGAAWKVQFIKGDPELLNSWHLSKQKQQERKKKDISLAYIITTPKKIVTQKNRKVKQVIFSGSWWNCMWYVEKAEKNKQETSEEADSSTNATHRLHNSDHFTPLWCELMEPQAIM